MTLKFYDLSNWQAGLKLDQLQSDAFIFKATEGLYFVDKACDGFVQQAKKLGKPYGVYHFLDASDVIKQADFFVKNVSGYVGEAVLVLDYEMYGRQGAKQAKRFLDRVKELTGVKPWLYMNESDANADDWAEVIKSDYALWIAKYSTNKPNLRQWKSYCAWQYTSTPLDLNEFYGDVNAWKAYAKSSNSKPVEPSNPKPPANITNYHTSGKRFKAKEPLVIHAKSDWAVLTGGVIEKGREFDIKEIVNNGTSTHAVLQNGNEVVTLHKSYVDKIK